MTAYFDQKRSELDAIADEMRRCEEYSRPWLAAEERLNALDKGVVWDVSLCAEMPGLPSDLRVAIHRVILRYSWEGQPRRGSVLDWETSDDHVGLIRNLIERLHTLFHTLGSMRLPNFTDDPRRPLVELVAKGEELREQLAVEQAIPAGPTA